MQYETTPTGYELTVDLPANAATSIGLPATQRDASHEVLYNGGATKLGSKAPAGACVADTIGWTAPLYGGKHRFEVRSTPVGTSGSEIGIAEWHASSR
jgi:hypothetical protein